MNRTWMVVLVLVVGMTMASARGQEEPRMETRQYVFDRVLMTKLAALAEPGRSVVQECLASHGIAFPDGTFARIQSGGGREMLVLRNTVANLERFEAVFRYDEWLKARIKMETDLVEVSDPLLIARLRGGLVSIDEIRKWPADKVRVVGSWSATVMSGEKGGGGGCGGLEGTADECGSRGLAG